MALAQLVAWNEWIRSDWVVGPAAFVVWVAGFWIAKHILLRTLHRIAARTAWTWDDVLVQALSRPLLIAIFASGLVLLERILPLPPEWDRAMDILLAACLVLALVLFVDRACRGVLDRLAATTPILEGARGLVQGIVRGIIIGLGLLIFLDSIGISITPILASLGIGSLAVALALKDTLANLFAGIHIIVDKPIEPGHFIRMEGGAEGKVMRVGWRSTWIRSGGSSVVVVPNSKLAESVITNYNLPDPQLETRIELGVHYDSDLAKVERVTLDVAREVQRSESGAAAEYDPRVRFTAFGDSSINLVVLLRASDYDAQGPLRSAFIKRIQERFDREEIRIPFPTRTIDFPPDPEDSARSSEFPAGPGPADIGPGDAPDGN
jgi:small-conductance mechanosensitive channel